MSEIIIGSHNFHRYTRDVVVDGERKARGLIPRPMESRPPGYYPTIEAVEFPLISRSEWSERVRDKVANQSQTSDIMKAKKVPCLDQNGRGYCWAFSTTAAVMALRALMNAPTVGLSAYGPACVIKQFQDQGGWGAESADFIARRGVPSEEFWPQQAVDPRYDNEETWADAAKYKITGSWMDLTVHQYSRNLTFEQYATLWLSSDPTVGDFNHWGHSVMVCDLVEGQSYWGLMRDEGSGKLLTREQFDAIWFDDPVTAGYGCRLRNSWGSTWGEDGFGVLAGSKAVPSGGLGLRGVMAS